MPFDEMSGKTVFVVDDNPINLDVALKHLTNEGLKVIPIKSGEEVIRLVDRRLPDIILLDIIMSGGIDGFETCKRLKQIEKAKDIPIIFMSALTETVDKVKGFKAGAVDYITKPIDVNELLSRIRTHLKISILQKKLQKMNTDLEDLIKERTQDLIETNKSLIAEMLERQQVQKALARNEEILNTILESTLEGVLVVSLNGEVAHYNSRFKKIWNIPEEVILDSNDEELLKYVLPRLKSPDTFLQRVKHLYEANEKSAVDEIEFKDGTILERFSTPFIIDGKVNGRGWFFRDITKQKKLEEQLRQAEKMRALGQLAGGVAHDFNNQLAGIMSYAELLKLDIVEDEQIEYINSIITSSQRAADLTKKLLAFSRKAHYLYIPLDITKIIDEVCELLKHSIDKRIKIKRIANGKSFVTKGDPSQLQNAILNLGVNARDAMPGGGELTFSTNLVTLDQDYCANHTFNITPGEYIQINVTDTGTGISPEILKKIFEPFFTTKDVNKGTGLGLSAVYGTAKMHKGAIEVYSEMGKGTTFKFYLPHIIEEEKTTTEIKGVERIENARLLIIDDDQLLRTAAQRILEQSGCEVTDFANGLEALEYYKKEWQNIDLTIIDVTMPEINGHELFRKMKEVNPQLKALLSSGYDLDIQSQEILQEGILGFIQKPYLRNDLIMKVKQTLSC